ncbi:MAG: ComEC/Rec2 family competence protein [Cyanobacteria bacterium J06554_6]
MATWGPLIIAVGYILGLASTGLVFTRWDSPLPLASYGVLLLGIVGSFIGPRFWRLGPTRKQWLAAAFIALIGAAYCVWRMPVPADDDVSQFAVSFKERSFYSVYGELESSPQITRSGKGRFWLRSETAQNRDKQAADKRRVDVSGKLYVTAPLDQIDGLYPGQSVKVTGKLYEPSEAEAPGEFDFRAYLASKGTFAGISAKYVDIQPNEGPPQRGMWQLRQRIVDAHQRWLGEPKGPVVSAMTLGRRAVNLPYEIQDAFIEAGLAHTLAASGFHVSLVLGLVLALLKTRLPKTQAVGGAIALLIYVGLTGLQPSVMRAAVMGFGALIGLALQRKVKPLGCLMVAVVLLLIWNPRWIWDIGFQLSVMATLGLMVTTTPLTKRLDWLPGTIATLVAVPLAAYLWTVPLQLHHFGVLPSYSILLNIVATPLVIVVSLGGFVSAMAALVWPLAGSAIAWLLAIPIQLLMWLVTTFNTLPGNQLQVGNIPAWTVVISYTVYGVISLWLATRKKPQTV